MLTMLPRFALVVVRMYFSVLANVLPAFLDAPSDDVEIALEQHEVGGLSRDVDGLRRPRGWCRRHAWPVHR